ncbi:MAG: hypothetical protein JWL62_612 [Hyphomicrobiales bacterium]|nr:hypothetical protein [Hyphomicrobiales bacterium]
MFIFTRKALTLALGAAALSIAASAPASATYDYHRQMSYQTAIYNTPELRTYGHGQ